MNNKDETDYIATGLTEEIIVSLTQFPDFMVVGPLYRNVIREEKLNTRGIGEKYGVRFELDGSIRTDGRTLRMTVRLTDAVSGQNLWRQSLKCDLQDVSIFAGENNVLDQVAAAIGDEYGAIPLALAEETFKKQPENPTAYEAILRVYHYLRCLTEQLRANAETALKKALQHDPDNAKALAMLGNLTAVAYQLGFATTAELDHAEAMIRKAVALDPNTQVTRYPMALIHFVKFQREMYMAEAEQVLRLNPNHALYVACVAVDLGMMGDWQRSMKWMDRAIRLNPHHPGWYHILPFMNAYRQEEYERAWDEAQRFNTPDLFWDPLLRAAVLGQLDRRPEGEKTVAELLALMTDFAARGPRVMRRMVFTEENVALLLEGLRKAGLETQSEV